ncbi:biotin/lipoyl-containing protein [Polycladomyces subterraneus]|uniref:Biotin/lipoyl-binding protein n=1 Tax=Polycladomyces subterraneus TaxID=1016997 RepID=A0ABT8IQY4_9BACL|nr:biotin/lipoyl-containing protein [Polycladomyces subterraneus]MDN4594509.1 biotin/lipoyl-binding protein [Polycladomyces subterraneus]
MKVRYEIISPFHGIITHVLSSPSSYIYEGESVYLIKTEKTLVEIKADLSGSIVSLHVKQGEVVAPGKVLATIEEDFLSVNAGSD